MADLTDTIKSLFVGDEESEVVKSSTLAVTRFTGWVGAIAVALTNLEVFGELSGPTKLWASVAILGVFGFIVAADALARGYATAHTRPDVRALHSPMKVTVSGRAGAEETGWKVFLVRFDPTSPEELDLWAVRGSEAAWFKGKDVTPV